MPLSQRPCETVLQAEPADEKKLRVRGREHLTLDLRTISIRTGSQVSPLKLEVSVHSDMALSLPAWLYNGSRAS